jgi:hypothetical protein
MTTDITLITKNELAELSTSNLRTMLTEAIGVTAVAIARVAMIWVELERRGEDLSRVKFALRGYMRGVANGKIIPEAVALLAGKPSVLSRVAAMPAAEQRRLLGGAPIEVVDSAGTVAEVKLLEMAPSAVAKVIANGAVMSVAEQVMAMERSSKRVAVDLRRAPRVSVDLVAKEMRVGGVAVPLERVFLELRKSGYQIT